MSLPPPAQRGSHSPPALIDDAMTEIFLRVPADDPKTLVRAAAVCTTWCRILCDHIFTRQYRTFHGAPPMLGFLHNARHERSCGKGRNEQSEEYLISTFVSTASFSSPACRDRRHWRVLDSRYGLVLFYTPKRDEYFVVCDLVTYDLWRINVSDELFNIIWFDEIFPDEDDVENEGITWNAAVLCAKDRCDHTYCHYGPFRVALVGSNKKEGITFASVYSSETRKWSDMISCKWSDMISSDGQEDEQEDEQDDEQDDEQEDEQEDEQDNDLEMTGHIAVLGDKVYFQYENSETTVEYNIGEKKLKKLSLLYPLVVDEDEDVVLPRAELIGVDDGMLLFARVRGPRLYLWSMGAGPNGAEEWVPHRVIELEPVLPPPALYDMSVAGFAEGIGVIFLSTKDGLYTIELNSGRNKRVHGDKSVKTVMPYMSFYTKAWGQFPTSH